MEAIQREIHHLDALCHDWSAWDDTYEFIVDKNSEYIESNLDESTFYDQRLNLIYFVNQKNEVVWGKLFDLVEEESITMDSFPLDFFPPDHPLLSFKNSSSGLSNKRVRGIFMTPMGPVMIASRPIITSENSGPVRGALIMGRFLNAEVVAALEEQTRVGFEIWSANDGPLPENIKAFAERLSPANRLITNVRDEDNLEVYTSVSDILGETALLLRATLARDITAKGVAAMQFFTLTIVTIGFVVLLVLLVLLQNAVVGPISQLTRHTISIGKSDDMTARLSMKRRDEIGILAQEFDHLVQKLRDLSIKDELTGLHNRRGFMALAEQELKVANRTRTKKYLLFADLDNFKYINDTFGHKQGDQALIDTANILKGVFRESDIIARMGGDEFAILFASGDNSEIPSVRINNCMDDYNNARDDYKLSLSVGLTEYDPAHPCSLDDLLSGADKLMYAQKAEKG